LKHSDVRARLSEYLERDLPVEERSRIGAHLESCSDCERELGELRETVSLLRGLPEPTLPPGIGAAVMARIANGEGREPRVIMLFRRAADPRIAAALAAGLAGLIFLVDGDGLGVPPAPANGGAATLAGLPVNDPVSELYVQHVALENASSGACGPDTCGAAGVVSGFTPNVAVQQYVTQLRLEQARRQAHAQNLMQRLRGANHPYSASLASQFDARPNVTLAGWQPR